MNKQVSNVSLNLFIAVHSWSYFVRIWMVSATLGGVSGGWAERTGGGLAGGEAPQKIKGGAREWPKAPPKNQ